MKNLILIVLLLFSCEGKNAQCEYFSCNVEVTYMNGDKDILSISGTKIKGQSPNLKMYGDGDLFGKGDTRLMLFPCDGLVGDNVAFNVRSFKIL